MPVSSPQTPALNERRADDDAGDENRQAKSGAEYRHCADLIRNLDERPPAEVSDLYR